MYKKERAFTFLELTISMFILSIMSVSIFMVMNAANVSWDITKINADLQDSARLAMDGMTREIRQTRFGNVTITNTTSINFTVPVSITAVPPTYSTAIRYYLNGTQLMRDDTVNIKVLANNITAVSFCCVHGGLCDADCSATNIVRVSLNATKTVNQRQLSFPVSEQLRLRN